LIECKCIDNFKRDWYNVMRSESTTKQRGDKNRATADRRQNIYKRSLRTQGVWQSPAPAFCTFLEAGIHGDITLLARIKAEWKQQRISDRIMMILGGEGEGELG
jgi:hypothetical protein